MRNLSTRNPASLRGRHPAPQARRGATHVDVAHVGFDIPNEFVVGYGLDYAERYRDLPYIGTLDPRVYGGES